MSQEDWLHCHLQEISFPLNYEKYILLVTWKQLRVALWFVHKQLENFAIGWSVYSGRGSSRRLFRCLALWCLAHRCLALTNNIRIHFIVQWKEQFERRSMERRSSKGRGDRQLKSIQLSSAEFFPHLRATVKKNFGEKVNGESCCIKIRFELHQWLKLFQSFSGW